MKYKLPKKVNGLKNKPRKGYYISMGASYPIIIYKKKEIMGMEPDVFLDLYDSIKLNCGIAQYDKLVFLKQGDEYILVTEDDKRYKKLKKKEKK